MPSQRVADAAHVAPYRTQDVTHHGQATLTPSDNVGRARQAKPKKSRQKAERNIRSEEDVRFDTGPGPLRNLVANRGARRSGRAGRQDRGRNEFLNGGNEDAYPDYPPPTFLEAISTPPLSVCPSTTTLVTMSQAMVTNVNRPPEVPAQSPSLSISSILPQTSDSSRRNSGIDSDDSLEIINTDSVQVQMENERRGRKAKESYRSESPHTPGTPRGRTKSRRPAILDSDSDDTGEIIRPPQANGRRKLSLSPLRTLFPYQSMVAQDRAFSAHPSPNNSPYASRSSFPFLSTTSLKMSMSTSSFLKFPTTPTTPSRSESFVSRKLSAFKGRERARSESLDTWEVVPSEGPSSTTVDSMKEPTTPTPPIQDQGSITTRPVPESRGAAEHSHPSHNNVGTHPLSLRDRKAPPVPRASKTVRRSAPPPPVQPAPPIPDPVVTPTSPSSQAMSNVHRSGNSSPTPKMKKPQVICASPLGGNRWRADDESDVPPSILQRALQTPLPSTPVEPVQPQFADVESVAINDTQTHPAMIFSSAQNSSLSRKPSSPWAINGVTTSPAVPDPPTLDPFFSPPTPIARGPSADGDTPGRHYPGRPLPRPPGPPRALVDSTYAGHEGFQVNGNTFSEGLLIDFNDTSLAESFTSRASTPQTDEGRYRTPIQLSAAPSTSSASSMELVEPVQEVSLLSQPDTSDLSTPPARRPAHSPASAQFLEVTDLDVLISRLHEEQHNGSDYDALLMLSDFIGPASPVAGTQSVSSSASGNETNNSINVPLSGDVEVERRRKTKDGRIKLKLTVLDTPVDKCGICLMQFRGNNVARLGSVCRHAFHDKCLGRWLVRSKTCPMCRVPFADQV